MTPLSRSAKWLATVALFALACSDSKSVTGTVTANRTWRGIIGTTGSNGTFDLTTSGSADARAITGSVKFGVTTTPLTGTHVISTGSVTANGGAFVLTGTVATSQLFGNFTGGGGGSFAGAEAATASDVKLYCGTYTETVGGTSTRYWSFSLTATTISGTAATSTTPIRLNGSLGATSVTVGSVTGPAATINSPDAVTSGALASGAVSATAAQGTFNNGSGTSGTWAGAICP